MTRAARAQATADPTRRPSCRPTCLTACSRTATSAPTSTRRWVRARRARGPPPGSLKRHAQPSAERVLLRPAPRQRPCRVGARSGAAPIPAAGSQRAGARPHRALRRLPGPGRKAWRAWRLGAGPGWRCARYCIGLVGSGCEEQAQWPAPKLPGAAAPSARAQACLAQHARARQARPAATPAPALAARSLRCSWLKCKATKGARRARQAVILDHLGGAPVARRGARPASKVWFGRGARRGR
jgi:hypothetical protein